MIELHTEIEINAGAEKVWRVLADFAAYPQWNPFIKSISGELAVGARLSVTLQPPGGRAMTLSPRVRCADVGRELRWLGRVLLPLVFDGEHRFVLEPVNGKTRFVHSERFRGMLVPFFRRMLTVDTRAGFVAMNEALKARVESAA